MTDMKKNIGASVRARLLNIARKTHRDYTAVMLQYFQERFLYRLSLSPFGSNFILKGALLFLAYDMPRLRPTKDIDFLASATPNDLATIKGIVEQVSRIEADDGVSFIAESVGVERIKEDADYEGVRVKLTATLDGARKILQLDIAFGDVVVAGPVEMDFPVLLEDQPAPHLRAYSKESAIAEKFEALVKLNFLTSRMKDVYDILYLAAHEEFEIEITREAINATFGQRKTPLEDRRVIFSTEFKTSRDKQEQWTAFLKRNRLESYVSFADAIGRLEEFLGPVPEEDSSLSRTHVTWDPATWKWRAP